MTEEQLAEYRASLALRHCRHVGPRTCRRLLGRYGSARDAVEQVRSWVAHKVASARQVEQFVGGTWAEAADAEHEAARVLRQRVLLYTDPRYPEALRQLPDPPLFLYYQGRIELLSGPSVAVVGSRNCSAAGIAHARRICAELSEAGLTVVSGMAWGIDRQAHLAGLEGPGSSVAVLGTGLDRTYPAENADVRRLLEERGLLVSEFAPGTAPEARNFPYRNRIVSGLSLGVVVVEAASRSGSRITARMALEQGREVYAVSGPEGQASFEGCRELLDEGAQRVSRASEIILDLAPLIRAGLDAAPPRKAMRRGATPARRRVARQAELPVAAQPLPDLSGPSADVQSADAQPAATRPVAPAASVPPLDGDERVVAELLAAHERMHIDDISRALGWDAARTSRTLLLLEVQGVVCQWAGMEYSLG
ncbi:DNA processing protein [Desulfobaculum xiamenense]|uniref:DNA processing protein n=1 Tax=Desulfobaculum xiamenense TaxID=995050 RepID=A0A846QV34_9BACT|nr:DNA-processing protein DprA [Desulfobaculum xiamenense]NJB69415.1 DNA processing protein [Desulfobaculum xiamenense]